MRDSVGRFVLDGRSYDSVLADHLVWLSGDQQVVSLALHVGGLNMSDNDAFVDAFNACDFAYADGVSVVLLARLAGIREVERAATTDLGDDLLRLAPDALGRAPRVAIVGGSRSLSAAASVALEDRYGVTVCYRRDGYTELVDSDFSAMRAAQPDVVFVGLGMPLEAMFCSVWRSLLPNCLVMTCGGWFGFIAGEEERAPSWARSGGLEWIFRLAQNPRRLVKRYALGVVTVGHQSVRVLRDRIRR